MKTKDIITELKFISGKLSKFYKEVLIDIYQEDWMDKDDLVHFNQINKDLITCINWLIEKKEEESKVPIEDVSHFDNAMKYLAHRALFSNNDKVIEAIKTITSKTVQEMVLDDKVIKFDFDRYIIMVVYECPKCKATEEESFDWGIDNEFHCDHCSDTDSYMEPVGVKISLKE